MHWLRIVIAVFLVLICSQALAERRVALVIGNSAYQHAGELASHHPPSKRADNEPTPAKSERAHGSRGREDRS